jgi:hypothetical protein
VQNSPAARILLNGLFSAGKGMNGRERKERGIKEIGCDIDNK